MKDFIKKLLRENLDEMKTINKPIFGRGCFHNVYRFKGFPNRLFKIGNQDTVDEWVSTFEKYPEYFPKIYRIFPYKKNPRLTVVEIEMLDTEKAADELTEIDNYLLENMDKLDYDGEFISIGNFYHDGFLNILMNFAKTNSPKIVPLLEKWVNFLLEVAPIVTNDLARDIDLHVGNVAYDAQGNLKLIDI